jgi:hypothetical protein
VQRLLGDPEPLLVQESDMEILRNVCSWYFSKSRFIVVIPIDWQVASDFVAELLPFIHNKIKEKIMVSHIAVPEDFNVSPGRLWKNLRVLHQAFILIVEKVDALIQFLKFVQQNSTYPFLRNPRGNFLIIFLGTSENGHDEVNRNYIENKYSLMLRALWKELGILNTITMVIKYSNYRTLKAGRIVQLATFNPFINSLNSRGKLVVYNKNNMFNLAKRYTDILSNLRGYPVRISLFTRTPSSFPLHPGDKVIDYIGVDGLFMRNLAKRMNFTAIAGSPEDGNEYGYMCENNGTFTGSLGDILYDRTEISLNSRFVKEYGTNDIEFTLPVDFDNLCIVVPKAKRLPKWLAFFRVFPLHVLLALVCVYVGSCIISHILQMMYSFFMPVNKDTSLIATFIEMLPPLLSLSLVRMPSSRSQKVFVITYLVFGMIIASLFQGKLVTVLSKPDYYPDINTLEELDASGLVIATGSINLIENTFSIEESPLVKHLSSKVTHRNIQEGITYYVAKHQDIAALTRISNANYNVLLYRNTDGTFLLHIVREFPRTYSLAYIVPKGSPFLFRINHVITQLVESGIVYKWSEDTYFNMTAFYRSKRSGNDSPKVFSLEDLQMAFLILACGLFGSVMTFFVELTVKRVAFRKGIKCKTFTWPHKQSLLHQAHVRPSFRNYKI